MIRFPRMNAKKVVEMQKREAALESREGISAKSESLWAIYVRRFRKHTLGRVGLAILIVLYGSALLADVLSPYTMTWRDKNKSFHPPTKVEWFYTDREGNRSFRPFVYERIVTNIAFKIYKIVPSYTIRAVSQEVLVDKRELRSISIDKDPEERLKTTLANVRQYYRLDPDSEALVRLEQAITDLEASSELDAMVEFTVGTFLVEGEEREMKLYLVKGNKNFLSIFSRGVPYEFLKLFRTNRHFLGSVTGGTFFWGADQQGRDIFTRMLHGGRISLTVGIVGALLTFIIGLAIGGIAGFFGGKIDVLLMRFGEIVMAFPSIYLLFALRASFPSSLNSSQVYMLIVIILSFIGWASLARIIRGLVLSLKNEDFVLSARTMGLSNWKIIRRHILPNTLSFVIIQATLTIPGYILGESALSLLGLGIMEPQSSWGLLLSAAKNYGTVQNAPWLLVPGFAIFLAIMAWNFFGDGIRDAVDPRSKH
jgi:peptide/nickel transport system permease protein